MDGRVIPSRYLSGLGGYRLHDLPSVSDHGSVFQQRVFIGFGGAAVLGRVFYGINLGTAKPGMFTSDAVSYLCFRSWVS
eukprot:8927207-Pyramimonas_sp.AAC.1